MCKKSVYLYQSVIILITQINISKFPAPYKAPACLHPVKIAPKGNYCSDLYHVRLVGPDIKRGMFSLGCHFVQSTCLRESATWVCQQFFRYHYYIGLDCLNITKNFFILLLMDIGCFYFFFWTLWIKLLEHSDGYFDVLMDINTCFCYVYMCGSVSGPSMYLMTCPCAITFYSSTLSLDVG